jgi:hypothetical protein
LGCFSRYSGTRGTSEKAIEKFDSDSMKDSNKFYIVLACVSFGLNWVWEMTQMFAFDMGPGRTRAEVFLFCTLATVIDAAVTASISRVLKSTIKTRSVKFYLAAAFFGALCAVFFEWFARLFNLWSYNQKMIVIPFLETGLLPILQLTLLVPLAIWLAGKFRKI